MLDLCFYYTIVGNFDREVYDGIVSIIMSPLYIEAFFKKRKKPKFQVQVSHLLKFIGYLVFVGYLAAKDSSDSSSNKHSRGVA